MGSTFMIYDGSSGSPLADRIGRAWEGLKESVHSSRQPGQNKGWVWIEGDAWEIQASAELDSDGIKLWVEVGGDRFSATEARRLAAALLAAADVMEPKERE